MLLGSSRLCEIARSLHRVSRVLLCERCERTETILRDVENFMRIHRASIPASFPFNERLVNSCRERALCLRCGTISPFLEPRVCHLVRAPVRVCLARSECQEISAGDRAGSTVISRWAGFCQTPRFPPRPRSVDGAAATVITCLLYRPTNDPIPARASYFK